MPYTSCILLWYKFTRVLLCHSYTRLATHALAVQKRKHAAAAPSLSVNGPSPLHVTSVTHQKAAVPADVDDYSSDEEKAFDVDAQWNWREDKRCVANSCILSYSTCFKF